MPVPFITPKARALHRSFAVLSAALMLANASCNTGPKFALHQPSMAPEVNKALPPALQAPTTSSALMHPASGASYSLSATAMTEVTGYVASLFQGHFMTQTGNVVQGYVYSLAKSVDERMTIMAQETSGFEASAPPPCLSATPQSFAIDLSAIDPMLKLTLNQVQCSDPYTTGSITPGSGLIYGQNGSNYSMWLTLGALGGTTFGGNGGFILAANLQNYQSTTAATPEQIDGMLVDFSPQSVGNRFTITRFKATPTAHTFELFLGSSVANVGAESQDQGSKIYLGAGFRMISNGTNVYADGLMWDPSSTPAAWLPFSVCLLATGTTVSVDPTASDCTTLSTSFTLSNSASLTFGEVSGTGLTGASIPGPLSQANTAPPTAAVINLFNKVAPISTAAAVTTPMPVGVAGGGSF